MRTGKLRTQAMHFVKFQTIMCYGFSSSQSYLTRTTIAPEIVEFETNTSVLQDENLASRIGLVPIDADPKMFDFPQDQDWMTNPKVCSPSAIGEQ